MDPHIRQSGARRSLRIPGRGSRYWRNLLVFAIISLTVATMLSAGYQAWRGAMHYLHPPRSRLAEGETPAQYGVEYEEIELQTEDGLRLAAWFTPSRNGGLILVAHGYGAHRPSEVHALFANHGYGVLSWDFRAHGESQGELCTFGYYELRDFEAAVEYAQSQIGVESIGAWGGSMGGAISILATAEIPAIEAVAVDSAYAALEDELEIMVASPILRPLIAFFGEIEAGGGFDRVRPTDRIGDISPRPVLIMHGSADQTIPKDSGQRLYDAAGDPRTLWQITEAGHMQALHQLPDEYAARVLRFFDRALLGE